MFLNLWGKGEKAVGKLLVALWVSGDLSTAPDLSPFHGHVVR